MSGLLAHDARPTMTVVVMGYRDEATIERAVRSVVEQASPEPFEVVVVTSGGDRSAAIVRARFPELRVIDSPVRLLPGGARNAGIEATDAELVAFLAADCIALPGWVARRVEHHRHGRAAVASAVIAGANDGIIGQAGAFLLFPGRMPGHPEGPATHSQSFGLSYARSLLDDLGPFDASLRTGEDSLMMARMARLGTQPWFDPAIQTAHPGPVTVRALLGDQFRRGKLRCSWELLRPPGRGQRWLEAARTRLGRAAVAFGLALRNMPQRTVHTAGSSVRGADDRATLLRCVPLIALGIVANQAGWGFARYASLRDRAGRAVSDEGPLMRWVSTDGGRVAALTFDDGPSECTGDLLDELARLGVVATFFVRGDRVAGREALVKRMLAAGHAVGTVGIDGQPLTDLEDGSLEASLRSSAEALGDVLGRAVSLARPPGGHYDARVISAATAVGLTVWLWTIDPEAGAIESIAAAVHADLAPGAVIRFHDGAEARPSTAGALEAIVSDALDRGFRFVALPEVRAATAVSAARHWN
ncbi:MAG: polysaccharide deacetylase family protein [Microthrixaceae bacterium]